MLALHSQWAVLKYAWQLQACPCSPGAAQRACCSSPRVLAA